MSEITAYAVRRPSGFGLTLTARHNDIEVDGYVETTHGYVRCFSNDYTNEIDGKRYRWTSLSIVLNGVSYSTKNHKFLSKRGLVTVAQRFANHAAALAGAGEAKP